MRKVAPTDLCEQVQDEIVALRDFYSSGLGVLNTAPHAAKRLSVLSELVFHRAYVAMECFLSAYFVGCINRDASAFLAFRRDQIRQSIAGRYTPWDAGTLTYSPGIHLPLAVVTSLLDRRDENVTFTSFGQMVERAREWLAPEWSRKVIGIPEDRQLVMDAARAVRNCIAHQSKIAFVRMNQALRALPNVGNADLLRREVNAVNSVGAYLKSVQAGERRTNVYMSEFHQVAELLK